MKNETLPMKYSPKWLLEKILSCGNQHGKALMYIIEFQNAIASDSDLMSVNKRFNSNSFLTGVLVGLALALICLHFII
jgi:hypothetical protein